MSEQYSVHRILNHFETYFKHRRLETKVSHIYDNYINIQATYAKNQPLNELNTNPNWTEQKPVGEKRDYADCYIMVSLQVEHNTNPWHLMLRPDKIYINPYTCPDINLARDFIEAKKQFDQQINGQSYEIRLDKKMLTQSRQKVLKAIRYEYEDITNYGDTSVINEYAKENQLTFLDTHINNMRGTLDVLQFLCLGPYGSGNPELDSYHTKQNTQS